MKQKARIPRAFAYTILAGCAFLNVEYFMNRLIKIILAMAVAVLSTTILQCSEPVSYRSHLLEYFIYASPLILLIRRCRVIVPGIDLPLILYCLASLVTARFIYPESMRWSTTLYGFGFCFMFAMTARLIRIARLSERDYTGFIKLMIYAYCVVLISQQISTLFGWPVINHRDIGVPFKLNALASESSHVGFTVGTFLFFLNLAQATLHPREKYSTYFRKNAWVMLAALWCLLTVRASTNFVMLPIAFLPLLSFRNASAKRFTCIFLGAAALSATYIFIPGLPRPDSIERIASFSQGLVTLDEEKIITGDISASERIVPMMRIAAMMAPRDPGFWIGHGTDADVLDLPISPMDDEPVPYLFHVWYNYGLLAELALAWLTVSICLMPRRPWTWFLTVMAVIILGHNTSSSIWLILTLALQFRMLAEPESRLLDTFQFPKRLSLSLLKS